MRLQVSLPEWVENFRDQTWCRDAEHRVEDAVTAEQFIDAVGFCSALTDVRRPGPSLYIAVCGRRDAHLPRNVQKDPETSLTWTIKDEVMRRGRAYYAKVFRPRSVFIARPLISAFHALLGIPRRRENELLSSDALAILKVLRREWDMATGDLRSDSGIRDRARFNKALDELQRTFKVIPSDVIYQPTFSYIWSLPETRFADELTTKVSREEALTRIARAYLSGAGMTLRGELARVTGLPAPDVGLGNWALVDEQFAERLGPGVYRLKNLNPH